MINLKSVSEMSFGNDTFDIITAFETVYFWPDIKNDFTEVNKVLKKDGIFLICNEALPKEDDERQKEFMELLECNIYSEEELTENFKNIGFSNVKSIIKESKDSFICEDDSGIYNCSKVGIKMIIRTATLNDLDDIHNVESECFSVNEAASKKEFEERLTYYPNHFWLIFDEEKLIAFIDGFVTDEKDLRDEMYENASLHDENGLWQMIFGINTLPKYRKQGYASRLINQMINCARKENRLGVVLTCKKELVNFYSKFGFIDEGISESQHGGVVWHQMRLKF